MSTKEPHVMSVHCICHKTKVEKGPQGPDEALGRREHRCIVTYCHSSEQRAGPPGMHPGAVVTPRGAEDKGHLEAVVLQWSGTQVQTQWLAFCFTLEGKERTSTSGMMR